MQLEHDFTVPVPLGGGWEVMLDVERIAPCMPGATVESFDGETINGHVRVKVGPIQVSYRGTARFAEKDPAARRVVLEAQGREVPGARTARATVTAQLHEKGGDTWVTVLTDLAVTGRPAQFGRGVMAEVGAKLIGRFADCLAETLQRPADAAAGAAGKAGEESRAPTVSAPSRTDEPLDLLHAAGRPLLKRIAPVAAGLAVLVLAWRWVRRRR